VKAMIRICPSIGPASGTCRNPGGLTGAIGLVDSPAGHLGSGKATRSPLACVIGARTVALVVLSGLATFGFVATPGQAQGTIKIGVLLPMTGQSQSIGAQITAAIRLYMGQHGDPCRAGKSR
jgi:hypothetical protein